MTAAICPICGRPMPCRDHDTLPAPAMCEACDGQGVHLTKLKYEATQRTVCASCKGTGEREIEHAED